MKRPPTSIIRFLYISDISLWCPEFRRNDPERNAKLGVLKCMPDHIAGEIYLADYLLYRLNRRDWWPLVVLLVDGLKVRKFTKVRYWNVDLIFIVFQCSMVRACHKTVAGIGSLTMSLSTLAMSFNFSRRQTVTVHGWGWSCQLLPMTSVTFVLTFLTFCCERIWRRDFDAWYVWYVWYVCIWDWIHWKNLPSPKKVSQSHVGSGAVFFLDLWRKGKLGKAIQFQHIPNAWNPTAVAEAVFVLLW